LSDTPRCINDVYSNWIAGVTPDEKRKHSSLCYEKWIRPKWGETPIDRFSSGEYTDWRSSLPFGPQRKKECDVIIRGILKEALKREWLFAAKYPLITSEKVSQNPRSTFNDDEVEHLISYLKSQIGVVRKARSKDIRTLLYFYVCFFALHWNAVNRRRILTPYRRPNLTPLRIRPRRPSARDGCSEGGARRRVALK